MQLNFNEDAIVEYVNKLEKLNDKAFPKAVKNTINGMAFQMKGAKGGKGALVKKAQSTFTQRNKGFFKVASEVSPTKSETIGKMVSLAGFTDKRLKGSNTDAVSNLEQQEAGGTLQARPFTPLDTARVGKSYQRKVRKKRRFSSIDNVINARTTKGASKAERFTLAALEAGKGGFVLGTQDAEGKRYLLRVNSVKRQGGDTVVNSTPLYVYNPDNSFRVPKTGFVAAAAKSVLQNAAKTFRENAEFQISKYS